MNKTRLVICPVHNEENTLQIFYRRLRGNYEWIQDRVMERFFQVDPPFYAVVSATFCLPDSSDRESPFFLYPPEEIKKVLQESLEES